MISDDLKRLYFFKELQRVGLQGQKISSKLLGHPVKCNTETSSWHLALCQRIITSLALLLRWHGSTFSLVGATISSPNNKDIQQLFHHLQHLCYFQFKTDTQFLQGKNPNCTVTFFAPKIKIFGISFFMPKMEFFIELYYFGVKC